MKAVGKERGLRVFDDLKRLDRDYAAAMAKVRERTGAGEDDLIDLAGWAAEKPRARCRMRRCCKACGALRLHIAAEILTTGTNCSIRRSLKFLWVVDFPMFEWDDEEKRWKAAHHPFTSVHG